MKLLSLNKIAAIALFIASCFCVYLFYLTKSPEINPKMWVYGTLSLVLLITSVVVFRKN